MPLSRREGAGVGAVLPGPRCAEVRVPGWMGGAASSTAKQRMASLAEDAAGADAVGTPVLGGEPAEAGEAPAVGDGEAVAGAGAGEVGVRAGEPDLTQVPGRGGAHVALEGELDGADGDGDLAARMVAKAAGEHGHPC